MAGSILDDTTFLSKVVFAGKLDAATHFDLKQTKRPLRAIRKVARGKLDAALVDDVQLQSLKGLPLFAKLSVIYESADVPNLGMVYVKGRAAAGDVKKFADALANMCQDSEGKKMCETFAVEGFEPIPAGALDGVRELYK
jgi:ABC-type amino acid transport substrate-binding protein